MMTTTWRTVSVVQLTAKKGCGTGEVMDGPRLERARVGAGAGRGTRWGGVELELCRR
jgi:hypothetical protein